MWWTKLKKLFPVPEISSCSYEGIKANGPLGTVAHLGDFMSLWPGISAATFLFLTYFVFESFYWLTSQIPLI